MFLLRHGRGNVMARGPTLQSSFSRFFLYLRVPFRAQFILHRAAGLLEVGRGPASLEGVRPATGRSEDFREPDLPTAGVWRTLVWGITVFGNGAALSLELPHDGFAT